MARRQGIDHHNRLLLVRARATGKTDGVVLIATRDGATPAVAESLRGLDAEVQARFDDVGYLRVRMPLARFPAIWRISDIVEAQIDIGNLSYAYDQGTDPAAVPLGMSAWAKALRRADSAAPLRPAVPAEALRGPPAPNPYVPMDDMGAVRFTRAHPTYDGRGVTIGVLEGGVLDLTHPTLQHARSIAGDSVPKVVGIIVPGTYAPDRDPARMRTLFTRDTMPDRTRVRPTGPVDASAGEFVHEGRHYRAPQAGRYQVGLYPGSPADDIAPRAVIWDSAGRVWVDTDGDRDLSGETPLGDFNRTRALGYLRRDSTAAKPRRSVPFVVVFDSSGTAPHLFLGTNDHQTMVASVAAGHNILSGGANASAFAAQLVVVSAGPGLGTAIEGFIRAARDPRIDLITASQAGEGFPGAGESLMALILDRLVRRYGKPIFAATANSGPGFSLVEEPSTSPRVLSIGGYVGRDSYRAHYGWHLDAPDWIIEYSGRGPARNGGLKPDLLAPVLSIAAAPCSKEAEPAPRLVYTLPPCYMIAGGTSSATPHAAGAAALLISAAKQAKVPYDAARIAWALRAGARVLPGWAMHEQGAGVVDVPRAWELLRGGVTLPEIEVSAPVRTALDPYLRVPGRGTGLFEREGWMPGDTGTRIVTLTRMSGSAAPMAYDLRWRGNDGTFSTSMQRVMLPLAKPVDVPIRIAPRAIGPHSAALQLRDRHGGSVVREVAATVVAAEPIEAAAGFTARMRGQAPWPRPMSFFVRVPPRTSALRVELRVAQGRYQLKVNDPPLWRHLTWHAYFKPYKYPWLGLVSVAAGDKGVVVLPAPHPGVWELIVEPPRIAGMDSLHYRVPGDVELVATALGVDGRAVEIDGAPALEFENRLAPLDRAEVIASLGSRRTVTGSVDATAAGPMYDIDVPPGMSSLRVAVEPLGEADLDLYLYDCTSGRCSLWDAEIVSGPRSELIVRMPRPGAWKAVIDPARVPGGTVAFRYTDVLTDPGSGTVDVATRPSRRASGERWTERVAVRAIGSVPPGREPVIVSELIDHALDEAERIHPLVPSPGAWNRPAALTTLQLRRDGAGE